jgi:hypothetical protein
LRKTALPKRSSGCAKAKTTHIRIKMLKTDELLNHCSEHHDPGEVEISASPVAVTRLLGHNAAIEQSAWPNCGGHACDDYVVDSLSFCVLVGLGRGQRLAVD